MTITRKVLYGTKFGCQISEGLTESGQAYTGSGVFHGFIIKCDGVNDVILNVYDNTSAAGKKLILTDAPFDGTVLLNAFSINPGAFFDNGIYIELACAGAVEVMALYNPDED